MRGKGTSDEVKAQVMAALLAGQGVGEVAKAYKLSKSTVSNLKSKLGSEQFEQFEPKTREAIGDLIEGYLRKVLKTLEIQADHFADKTWLSRQSADALAVNHGVLADKAFRLIEAAELASEPTGEEGAAGGAQSAPPGS